MKSCFLIVLFLFLLGCGKKDPQLMVLQGSAFGTTYSIQFHSEDDFDAEKGIDSVLAAVNESVSTYLPSSAISRINRGDTTVVVDSIFKEVLRISKMVHANSGGYFDPTVGVLRNAYGFGTIKPIAQLDRRVLDSLMQYVGLQKVRIRKNGTVFKEAREIYLDFNAVAKGYGIDCLGRYLETQDATDFLIELGGEILARGINVQKKKPWVVGIESADSELDNRSYSHIVELLDIAMASSGNYRKFRIDSITGKKYVHTINPLTGLAEQSDITSATVLAKTCGLADAYATTFMAMGLQKSKELLSGLVGVEAYLTYWDENHQPQVFMTEGFRKRILE